MCVFTGKRRAFPRNRLECESGSSLVSEPKSKGTEISKFPTLLFNLNARLTLNNFKDIKGLLVSG